MTVNVDEFCPGVTVTVAGTDAAALLLESATLRPLEPAFPVRLSVPVDGRPPGTEVGLTVTYARPATVIVRVPDFV